jgi:hypothetical protein
MQPHIHQAISIHSSVIAYPETVSPRANGAYKLWRMCLALLIGCAANLDLQGEVKSADGKTVLDFSA